QNRGPLLCFQPWSADLETVLTALPNANPSGKGGTDRNGALVSPAGGRVMKAINPATTQLLQDYPESQENEVEERLQRAHAAFHSWRQTSFAERAELLRQAARLLRRERAVHARLMTEE